MQYKKEVSTVVGTVIIIIISIIFFGGAIVYLNVELEKVTFMFLDSYSASSILK